MCLSEFQTFDWTSTAREYFEHISQKGSSWIETHGLLTIFKVQHRIGKATNFLISYRVTLRHVGAMGAWKIHEFRRMTIAINLRNAVSLLGVRLKQQNITFWYKKYSRVLRAWIVVTQISGQLYLHIQRIKK